MRAYFMNNLLKNALTQKLANPPLDASGLKLFRELCKTKRCFGRRSQHNLAELGTVYINIFHLSNLLIPG